MTERHTFLPSRSILVGASESAVADHIVTRIAAIFLVWVILPGALPPGPR
jgi:hypothetical protein